MNIVRRCLVALIDIIRPSLGPSHVCVYHFQLSCGRYAKYMVLKKPLYVALPLIALRIASCNPITGIGRWLYFKVKLFRIK
ncbi:MAG: hypothetical protein WCT20_05750 [Candidatus Babeliales bacterium]